MKTRFPAVAVVVFAMLAGAYASQSDESGTRARNFPRVVAKVNLKNQTAVIPNTTIFTPDKDGLFRISVYMTLTSPGFDDSTSWNFDLFWTDDLGAESDIDFLVLLDVATPPTDYATAFAGFPVSPFTFWATAGHPISYDVTNSQGAIGAYALRFVVEQLE